MLLTSWLRNFTSRQGRPGKSSRSGRLKLVRLEPRRVLSASPLFPMQDPTGGALSGGSAPADDGGGLAGITIDAGGFADDGAADTFRVYRSGEGVGVSVNGNEVFSGILGDSDTLTILGSSDADRLLVELGPDGLPTTQIQFDAGDQPAGNRDLLVLTGSSTSVTHTIGSVGDGHASANGAEIVYQGVEDLHDRVDSAT